LPKVWWLPFFGTQCISLNDHQSINQFLSQNTLPHVKQTQSSKKYVKSVNTYRYITF